MDDLSQDVPESLPPLKSFHTNRHEIFPQRCHKCDCKLEPGDDAIMHTEMPMAWCRPCVENSGYGALLILRKLLVPCKVITVEG